jgi:uncharacterized membrane protein
MTFSKARFEEAAAAPVEWHVVVLSLLFGGLFAGRLVGEQDVLFFLVLGLAAGLGYTYASSYFLSWLIRLSGKPTAPQPIRMVVGYSLAPFILGLLFIVLGERQIFPKLSALNFVLIVSFWFIQIYGIKVVAKVPWIQALFVSVIPILALMLVIALSFKAYWMVYGH